MIDFETTWNQMSGADRRNACMVSGYCTRDGKQISALGQDVARMFWDEMGNVAHRRLEKYMSEAPALR